MSESSSSYPNYPEEISEEDHIPDISESEAEGLREFLIKIGQATQRQIRKERERTQRLAEIKHHAIRRWDEFDSHIIMGITRGCAEKMRNQQSRTPCQKTKFLLYDAQHQPTGQDRIFKFVNPLVLVDRPELDVMIRNEFHVISRLDHPNIVKTHGLVMKGPMSYLILEYLPYQVNEIIGADPEVKGIAFFALEAAKALKYLHEKGVVHGDIKPGQFMGGEFPKNPQYRTIKLLDFAGSIHPELELPARTSYTPQYAAPEVRQHRGGMKEEKMQAFTHKADIYSLGLTYAKIALGATLDTDDLSAVFQDRDHASDSAVEAICMGNHIPYRFGYLIRDMTAKDPDDRPEIDHVLRIVEELCMLTGAQDKVVKSRDLYSREITGIRYERAF